MGDRVHVPLEVSEQLAHTGREARAGAGDDRERVVERGAERRGAQALRVVRRVGLGPGQVGVADAGGDEPERDVLQFHLDLRLQADAERLRALDEPAANRVVLGRLGVIPTRRTVFAAAAHAGPAGA